MFLSRIADVSRDGGADSTKKTRAGKGRRILAIALYCVALLLLVEGGARVTWQVLDTSWDMVVPQEISRFDPFLGWSLVPGSQAVSKATGRPVVYAINAKGFRGPDIPYVKPAGERRIVLLGDSHAFGFGIPEDLRFSTLLEGYLPRTKVVNLAVSGYGMDQMLLTLTRKAARFAPDLIIAYVPHYADLRHLRDKVWGLGKPRYALPPDGALRLTNSPVANNGFLHALALDADRQAARLSRAYRLLRDAVFHCIVTREQLVAKGPDAATLREAERLGEAIVAAMARESAAHGAKFLLVTRVGELAVHAINAGIPCLFLGDSLNNPHLSLRHDPTRHPNEAANGIIAWAIARDIERHHLLPPIPTDAPPPLDATGKPPKQKDASGGRGA